MLAAAMGFNGEGSAAFPIGGYLDRGADPSRASHAGRRSRRRRSLVPQTEGWRDQFVVPCRAACAESGRGRCCHRSPDDLGAIECDGFVRLSMRSTSESKRARLLRAAVPARGVLVGESTLKADRKTGARRQARSRARDRAERSPVRSPLRLAEMARGRPRAPSRERGDPPALRTRAAGPVRPER